MKCLICEVGETEPGAVTVTLEKDGTIIVIKNVPADICQVCGEAYILSEVTNCGLKGLKVVG